MGIKSIGKTSWNGGSSVYIKITVCFITGSLHGVSYVYLIYGL